MGDVHERSDRRPRYDGGPVTVAMQIAGCNSELFHSGKMLVSLEKNPCVRKKPAHRFDDLGQAGFHAQGMERQRNRVPVDVGDEAGQEVAFGVRQSICVGIDGKCLAQDLGLTESPRDPILSGGSAVKQIMRTAIRLAAEYSPQPIVTPSAEHTGSGSAGDPDSWTSATA